jgi:hypothetical protein
MAAATGQEGGLVGMVCGIVAVRMAGGRSIGVAVVMAVAMIGGLLFGQDCMRCALRRAEGEGWRERREHKSRRDCDHRQLAKDGGHKSAKLLENPEYAGE